MIAFGGFGWALDGEAGSVLRVEPGKCGRPKGYGWAAPHDATTEIVGDKSPFHLTTSIVGGRKHTVCTLFAGEWTAESRGCHVFRSRILLA